MKDELGEDARCADAAENADDAERSGGAAEAGDLEHRYRGEQVEPAPGAKIVEAIFGVIEADEKIEEEERAQGVVGVCEDRARLRRHLLGCLQREQADGERLRVSTRIYILRHCVGVELRSSRRKAFRRSRRFRRANATRR